MSDATPPGVADAASRARDQVLATLASFRATIEARFAQTLRAEHDELWHRNVLLGVELWLKLEEHVVVPGLRDGDVASTRIVQSLGHDGEVLRDLLAEHAQSPGLIENAAQRHMQATESLLRGAEARAWLNWTRVHADIQAWMKRWRDEIAERGDIEDEERDPVGLPPR
jgi:hypothetical protein